MAFKLTRREFRASLTDYISALRQTIEAECPGFPAGEKDRAARRAAVLDPKSGYDTFVTRYFPHYIRHPARSRLHTYLFSRLPAITESPKSELDVIAAPRGEAKSTLVSQLFALWCIITQKKRFIVIIMDAIEQAYPMLESIKTELEFNPRLKTDFPDAVGSGRVWQMGSAVTAQGTKIVVAGSGKKLRGLRHGAYRPDLVILDDIENDENVRSPEQRDKLDAWLKKTVLPLGEAGGKTDVIYIGTILHYDSVLSRTLNNPLWTTARFRAVIRWPLNMALWDQWESLRLNRDPAAAADLYRTHEAELTEGAVVSWSARPLLTLMEIRARDGHAVFDSEYQNDPAASADNLFAAPGILKFWREEQRDWIYFGAVDPSLGKSGTRHDPSAILIGGYSRATGILDVITADIRRRLPDKIINDVIALQRKFCCLCWSFEAVQFQELLRTELVRQSAALGVPVPAIPVIPSADKKLRIESLQPHLANGLIRLNPDLHTLIDQLRHFPLADHDDGPDALHMLWSLAVSRSAPVTIHTPGRTHRGYRPRAAW